MKINWKKRANKQYETGRNGEKQNNWKKKTSKTRRNLMILKETGRNMKKREETVTNGKRRE